MDYQALYRKYRPQRFDEVIGQDHVTKTLAREIVEGKIAHAYLFAGPRGTGKTTCARLLAKALNCTDLQENGEPCNVCDSCVGITGGHSLDVIELDAASHNKVEDIREIRMNVGTVAAVGGARRIYILDEAHMLSRAAGNALLKTLEEPPEHVIFVLATTEPYKMLDTIRSRSQRFDFHPIPVEILIDYLREISVREGFTPEPEGLALIASHARGSVRDALNLLEQVAALGVGKVEAAAVARALKETPAANAHLVGDELRILDEVNVGIAMAVPEGLLVPVIKNADQKSLLEIAQEVRELARKAKANSLSIDEMTGSTFSITNLSSYDIEDFNPLLNLPETGILGIGSVGEVPAVVDGKVVVRSVGHLNLAFDHRAWDGAPAAEFVRLIAKYLGDPSWMTA